jgi:hypothetical protein
MNRDIPLATDEWHHNNFKGICIQVIPINLSPPLEPNTKKPGMK